MTVQELIDLLEKIERKDKDVIVAFSGFDYNITDTVYHFGKVLLTKEICNR